MRSWSSSIVRMASSCKCDPLRSPIGKNTRCEIRTPGGPFLRNHLPSHRQGKWSSTHACTDSTLKCGGALSSMKMIWLMLCHPDTISKNNSCNIVRYSCTLHVAIHGVLVLHKISTTLFEVILHQIFTFGLPWSSPSWFWDHQLLNNGSYAGSPFRLHGKWRRHSIKFSATLTRSHCSNQPSLSPQTPVVTVFSCLWFLKYYNVLT